MKLKFRNFFVFDGKIHSCLFLLLLVMATILVFTKASLDRVVRDNHNLIERYVKNLSLADAIRFRIAKESELAQLTVLTGDEKYYKILLEQRAMVMQFFSELRRNLSRADDLAALELGENKYIEHTRVGEKGLKLRLAGRSLAEVHSFMHRETRPLKEQENDLMDDLRERIANRLREATAVSSDRSTQIVRTLTAVIAMSLAMFLLVTVLVALALRQNRRLNEKTRQLAAARKEIVDIVSHDLKNPLATIKMSTEMALWQEDDSKLTPELRRGLLITQRSAESMHRLISNLLDHSKIEAAQMVLDRAEINVSTLIRDLISRCQIQGGAKGIQINLHMTKNIRARLDAVRFEQVLANIVGNAIKFTPEAGTVDVTVDLDRGSLLIKIEDSGAGIPVADLPLIFERFWQAPETAKQGTGLGLAIAKAIVEAHGGQISVESTVGRGTCFQIRVPTHTTPELPICLA